MISRRALLALPVALAAATKLTVKRIVIRKHTIGNRDYLFVEIDRKRVNAHSVESGGQAAFASIIPCLGRPAGPVCEHSEAFSVQIATEA